MKKREMTMGHHIEELGRTAWQNILRAWKITLHRAMTIIPSDEDGSIIRSRQNICVSRQVVVPNAIFNLLLLPVTKWFKNPLAIMAHVQGGLSRTTKREWATTAAYLRNKMIWKESTSFHTQHKSLVRIISSLQSSLCLFRILLVLIFSSTNVT